MLFLLYIEETDDGSGRGTVAHAALVWRRACGWRRPKTTPNAGNIDTKTSTAKEIAACTYDHVTGGKAAQFRSARRATAATK